MNLPALLILAHVFVPMMSSDAWDGVLGAIFGTLVSGGISYALQRSASSQAASVRSADRLAIAKTQARSLIVKLNRIHAGFRIVRRHLDEEFARPRGLGAEPWQIVQPLLDDALPVEFTSEELALLMEHRLDQQFNNAVVLPSVYHQTFVALRGYASRREKLREMVKHERLEGRVGTMVLTEADLANTAPLRIEMNDLIMYVYRDASRNEQDSFNTMKEVHDGLNIALQLGTVLKVDDDMAYDPARGNEAVGH